VTQSSSRSTLDLELDGATLALDTLVRPGPDPVVFLHGASARPRRTTPTSSACPGSTAAASSPATRRASAGRRPPTCPSSRIPHLVDVALAALGRLGVERFHVVGHSMGGLTALLLADRVPEHVVSFVDIEGNLAPGPRVLALGLSEGRLRE